ncbi:hypothetical protein KCH_39660 [Kitasatospora cheerisanensis KCTC 2395]|uniref:Uncharacterized protein n=1 Tax=Kitasatospora cheerisanensis KCTC 2395 TaxID=1348663 RepID=A0A066Z215_9ACTN|nr:hypothetical protein KCH_39660 [Kitasatospora cheerisanensis KCTC 2395]
MVPCLTAAPLPRSPSLRRRSGTSGQPQGRGGRCPSRPW